MARSVFFTARALALLVGLTLGAPARAQDTTAERGLVPGGGAAGDSTAVAQPVAPVLREEEVRECQSDVAHGRLAEIRQCVETGFDVNVPARGGQTALHVAAAAGDATLTALLLSRGAAPDAMNVSSFTPLHLAADSGYVEVMRLLLDAGVDVNVRDSRGNPLHRTVRAGRHDAARLLLSRGARPDELEGETYNGDAPLHIAVDLADEPMARLLLEGGASVDVVSPRFRKTPLHKAACAPEANEPLVGLLLEYHAAMGLLDISGQTPLHCAVQRGHEPVVRRLLAHAAPVNARDRDGQTPLHYAAQHDQPALAQLLLDGGADAAAMDTPGRTALHVAEERGHAEVAAVLQRGPSGPSGPIASAPPGPDETPATITPLPGATATPGAAPTEPEPPAVTPAAQPSPPEDDPTVPPPAGRRVDVEATPTSQPPPNYPPAARRGGIEGTVVVEAWVTAEGLVQEARLAGGVHPLLDRAAVAAVEQWTFSPATLEGRPVAVWARVDVPFRLAGE